MERYYFLFAVALIWIVFATVQDLRKREIANWLNFSLIAIALAYRAFYAVIYDDLEFFVFGAVGFGIFFGMAHLFYYGNAFAGGDAKLLMGLGIVLPYENYFDFVYFGIGFVFLLFLVGAVYSLIYSIFLAGGRWADFRKSFVVMIKSSRYMFIFAFALILFLSIVGRNFYWFYLLFLIFPILYAYLRAVEKSCMIKLKNAKDLTEGDWLDRDIKVGGKWVRKSIHGLGLEEIKLLRRHNKKVWIKEGIPFTPAFLIAFLIMVFAYLFLGDWMNSILSLF